VLHPLPYLTFEAEEVIEAFRYMQQARHIGKIVVTYRNGISGATMAQPPARPSLVLPEDGTYLVTGGLGGFGLRTAQWLVERGARHLVLISRSGPASAEAKAALEAFAQQGVQVCARACDVTDRAALRALLVEIGITLPPLKGIVHAATVIEDGLIRSMNRDQIRRVLRPKVLGAYLLHELTRTMPLDFFILFSSATTLFGNPGQGNYVAANSCLEALAEQRRTAGLPATCVCWGAIEDVGFLARNTEIREALQGRMGGAAIQSAAALAILEDLLVTGRSGLGVMEIDWHALSRFLPSAASPKFGELARSAGKSEREEGGADVLQRMLEELSDEELLQACIDMLKSEVGRSCAWRPTNSTQTAPCMIWDWIRSWAWNWWAPWNRGSASGCRC
jgi:NAD(P)-dependent dehydrogenase (short-subunit alcohol dehydrogenase family)